MLNSRKFTKIVLTFFTLMLCILSSAFGFVYADGQEVYLGGFAAGFVLNTTNVEVVGLCEITCDSGTVCPARDCGIEVGDIIKKVNDNEINAMSDINKALEEDYKHYIITLLRQNEMREVEIYPVTDNNNKRKLGLLVKDSVNGIGTVTYIDKINGKFASLGHAIIDEDNNLLKINGGNIYSCFIYNTKKGMRGNPGELKGSIESFKSIGKIKANTNCGVVGDLAEDYDASGLTKIKTAPLSSAKIGKAEIYSTVSGNKIKSYEISIVKVDEHNKENKNFVIKIDDDELLNLTGGIVQGMSGSPIVQNGKLIGAVTHVFVNDPSRGFGIGIEKMLSSY